MNSSGYTIEPIESAPFAQVSYVLWLNGSMDALIVDPGFDPSALFDVVSRHKLTVVGILNTHGHADHIAGNGAVKKEFRDAPLLIGRNEAGLLTDPRANLSEGFGVPFTSPAADRLVDDGERFELAGFSFEVREVPGHSPGSVVFLCEQFSPAFVFGGDVLFQGSVGRADLGGNAAQLLDGIKTKLLGLPDDTVVYPGHGSPTTIGWERKHNPYVGERAGLHDLG